MKQNDMDTVIDELNYDPLIFDYSWVYVRKEGWRRYSVGIAFDRAFAVKEELAGREILLWRRFDDLMAAVGYRMILTGLTNKELLTAVRRYNHQQKIRERFINMKLNKNTNPK